MKPLTAAAFGTIAWLAADRWRPEHREEAAGVAALVGLVPAALGGLIVAASVRIATRVVADRRDRRAAAADIGNLARSVLICLTAGLPLGPAMRLAAEHAHPLLRAEVEGLLRAAFRTGLADALATAEGMGSRLWIRLARGQRTGASMIDVVAAFVDERRDAERLGNLEAARRLPVRLTIPLALLILPGFVVLTVGPSVVATVRRMLGPVLLGP